jgi:DNA-binding CsgD family transcriptional regulator
MIQAGPSGPTSDKPRLVGRDFELDQIARVLATGQSSSATLALVGNPGVGKSALLAAAAARAAEIGTLVLQATGVEAESELTFAGLHQLLSPVMSLTGRLPARQAAALRGAFGLGEQAAPDRLLIGLATLTLLAEAADQQPVLAIVDDAQWLDWGSLEAIGFAVRRLRAEAVAVLVATRSEHSLERLGRQVARLVLEPLDAAAAAELLDMCAGSMRRTLRARVLDEAAGNPLALIELSAVVAQEGLADSAIWTDILPLTARLEAAFSARLTHLPEDARRMLLLAAAVDGTDLQRMLQAAQASSVDVDGLQAAEHAGLVAVRGGELRFRHPLLRSVVYQSATYAERRAAHLALAEVFKVDPERRAWHLAAATIQPDESIAALLEATAERSRLRAGYAASAGALQRAAELSPEPADQARRLTLATEMAFAAGELSRVEDLARRVHAVTDDPHLRALADQRVGQIQALAGGSADVPEALSPAALEAVMTVAPDVGLRRLVVAAGYAFLAGDTQLRDAAYRLAASVPGPSDEAWRLFIYAAGHPSSHKAAITAGIRHAVTHPPPHPDLDKMLAHVPWFVDDSASAAVILGRAVEEMRNRGDIGALATYLALLGFTCIWRDRWLDARAIAAEAIQLARAINEANSEGMALALDALVCALQGDADAAMGQASVAMGTTRARLVLAIATWSQGLCALATSQPVAAYQQLSRLFTPRGPEVHFAVSGWAIADLVDAAVQTGATAEVAGFVSEALRQAEQGMSVRASLVARRARALLAGDDTAEAHFVEALKTPGADEWPFEYARTQLSYGEWLRRRRRITLARPELRAALDTFNRLGAQPWMRRAASELRAAGVSLQDRHASSADELTPQERQIAQLAARGMTNGEIGAALFLSPRTVGFHLHNVFPKLQVTSRAQLAHLLGDEPS